MSANNEEPKINSLSLSLSLSLNCVHSNMFLQFGYAFFYIGSIGRCHAPTISKEANYINKIYTKKMDCLCTSRINGLCLFCAFSIIISLFFKNWRKISYYTSKYLWEWRAYGLSSPPSSRAREYQKFQRIVRLPSHPQYTKQAAV